MQGKNKDRVEHDVRRCTHDNGQHADLRKALTVYVRIQSERRHHAQRTEQINRQIRRRIRIRRIARAEQIQQRPVKDETDHRQHRAAHKQHEISVAHDALRALAVSFSARDRAQRRAARAEQIGERGHDRNHREAQAKPCERGRALPRDFADIDTVNYIIEQIEHLRDEHGRGKRQRFAAHAALGKVDLPGRLFLVQTGPSFLLTFCHIFTDSDLL